MVNPDTGDLRDALLFVATWGASSYTYAEATWSQNQADFINAHVHALEFFGGTPKILVPDNLKAVVLETHCYEYRHIKTSQVHIDYQVDYERHYYSVPFTLIKQEVEVHANSYSVVIYLAGVRGATLIRSYRHGHHSKLVSSQLPTSEWHASIGDATLADAILDRLMHNAHRIELKGTSMRQKMSRLDSK